MLAESAPAAARKNPARSRPLADSNAGLSNPRFQTRLPPNPGAPPGFLMQGPAPASLHRVRSEEHTSELQSLRHLVCRLLLEKKKKTNITQPSTRYSDHST